MAAWWLLCLSTRNVWILCDGRQMGKGIAAHVYACTYRQRVVWLYKHALNVHH